MSVGINYRKKLTYFRIEALKVTNTVSEPINLRPSGSQNKRNRPASTVILKPRSEKQSREVVDPYLQVNRVTFSKQI